MDRIQYRQLATAAGGALAAIWDTPFQLGSLPAAANAVYIATDIHSRPLYVGSVARSKSNGLIKRISEHRRTRANFREWRALWVIPLTNGTDESYVRQVEGAVGAALCPIDSECLPQSAPVSKQLQGPLDTPIHN